MSQQAETEQKGLVEALGLSEEEAFEAGFNLVGFFETLYRIEERLEREKLGKEGAV